MAISKMKTTLKNKENLNENDPKNEEYLKHKDKLQNEEHLIEKITTSQSKLRHGLASYM